MISMQNAIQILGRVRAPQLPIQSPVDAQALKSEGFFEPFAQRSGCARLIALERGSESFEA